MPEIVIVVTQEGTVLGFEQDGLLLPDEELDIHNAQALCHCDTCPEEEMVGWREKLVRGEV